MKTLRNNLIAKLHILMKETGTDQYKAELYAGYGVASSRDMTERQLIDLINRLQGKNIDTPAPRAEASAETRHLRSECLKVMTGDPFARNMRAAGLGIPNNWDIINPFVKHHAGALLNQLTDDKLKVLKRKLFAMRESGWRYRQKDTPREPETKPAASVPCFILPGTTGAVN